MQKVIKISAVLALICVSNLALAGGGDGTRPGDQDSVTTSCLLCGPVLQGGGGGTRPGDKDESVVYVPNGNGGGIRPPDITQAQSCLWSLIIAC